MLTAKEIDQLVADGGKFLHTLSTKTDIMVLMLGMGYSKAEHAEGWALYLDTTGYKKPDAAGSAAASNTEQYQAMLRVDGYDERAFRLAQAAFARKHPDAATYMFSDGLAAAKGPEALSTVTKFLDRYAALRDGTDPKRVDKKAADKAAATTLEQRNIVNPEIEKSLRADIALAQKLAPEQNPVQESASEEALQIAAEKFNAWLHDWRTTASVGITRRDYRVMLGISQRKHAAEEPAAVPDGAPTPVQQ